MIRQTAGNAEESAGAAEEMSVQARQKREIVRGLAVLVGGSRTALSNYAKGGIAVDNEPFHHGLLIRECVSTLGK
ncbi:MAG: hypothetical protein WA003_03440 [Desulfuromonadaceae bacterium]